MVQSGTDATPVAIIRAVDPSMSDNHKVLLVRKPTRIGLHVLPLFAKLGYDVRYLFYPEHMKTAGATAKGIEARLEAKGMRKINFSALKGLDQYGHLKDSPEFAKHVYDMQFKNIDMELLSGLYVGLEDCDRKLPVLIYDQLIKRVMEVGQTLSVAKALSDEGRVVQLFYPADGVQRRVLTEDVSGFTNVFPNWLSDVCALGRLGVVAARMVLRGVGKLWRLAKGRLHSSHVAPTWCESGSAAPCEVAYFPHQGVAYGNLFLKDHFYEDDTSSPFHPERILHVELNVEPPAESRRYYVENDIDYTVMGMGLRFNRASVGSFFGAIKTIWRATRNVGRGRILTVHVLFSGFLSYFRAWQNTAFLDGKKLALIGFDYLFPTGLALALQVRGIKLAAVQERLIHVFDNYFHPILDIYFISGGGVRNRLERNPFHVIDEAPVVGLVRLELLKSFMGAQQLKAKKNVLVLDFHTNPNSLDDVFNPFFCWESNKAFYQDILRLAAIHPKVKFIIRGKDDAWCFVPFFKDVVAQIEATPNVEVNREYDETNVSYKLAATADLIIARQTSLGDEAMAAGIPVLFHDWTAMRTHNAADVCDYDGFPVYTQSFDELAQRVDDVLSGRAYMKAGEFQRMQQFLFAASVESPKEKIMARLHKVLSDGRNRD